MRWTEEQYQNFLQKNQEVLGEKRKSKYNNEKTVVDQFEFDSKKEAEYYSNLKLLKMAGEIKEIKLQQKYILQPGFEKNGHKFKPITYIADFVVTNKDDSVDVIDIKGVETQVFRIKRKLFEYVYPDLNLKVVK